MKTIFLSMLTNSIVIGAVALACLLGSKALNRRVAARWKVGLWTCFCWMLLYPWRMMFDRMADWAVRIEVPEVELTRVALPEIPTAGIRTAVSIPTAPMQLPENPAAQAVTLLGVLSVLWAAGAVLFLAVCLWRYFRAWRGLTRGSRLVEEEKTLSMLNSLAAGLGVKTPALYRAPAAFAPMALWMCGRVVLLPDVDYDEETLSFILRHELTHLKQWDLSRKWMLLLANAVHWFNPVVWWMAREASADMERACDAAVVAAMEGDVRRAYADAILNTAQGPRGRNIALSTRFDGGAETLRDRFQHIFSGPVGRRGLALTLVIALTALLLAGMVSFTPVQAGAAGEDAHVEDACRQLAADFAAAYFGGDADGVRACLNDPSYEPVCYAEPGTVTPPALDEMRFSTVASGYMEICAIPFRAGAAEDNLKLRMIQSGDGWRVLNYWLDTEAVAEAERVARVYADAYFSGDAETMGAYTSLLSSTIPSAYAEPGTVEGYTLALGEIQETNQNRCEAAARFETADGAEMVLSMELIGDPVLSGGYGWRVLWHGVEPETLTPEQEDCAAAARAFAGAYFSGDDEVFRGMLSPDRLLDSSSLPERSLAPGEVTVEDVQVGEILRSAGSRDQCWCAVSFRAVGSAEPSVLHIRLTHIRLTGWDDGWKVSFYSVSGGTAEQLLLDAAREEDAGIAQLSIAYTQAMDFGAFYRFFCSSAETAYEGIAIVAGDRVKVLELPVWDRDAKFTQLTASGVSEDPKYQYYTVSGVVNDDRIAQMKLTFAGGEVYEVDVRQSRMYNVVVSGRHLTLRNIEAFDEEGNLLCDLSNAYA